MGGVRWILVAFALIGPAAAQAASVRALLLPLDAGPVRASLATSVAEALDEAILRLPSRERIQLDTPPWCEAADRGCLGAAAIAAGADEVIHASLRQLGDTVVLLLVRAAPGEPGLRRLSEALPAGGGLGNALHERLVRLLTPDAWHGSLEVEASPGSAIWLDGELRGVAPLDGPLEGLVPGPHLLRVVRQGQGEARASIEIRFQERTRVRIEPRTDGVEVVTGDPERSVGIQPPAAAASLWPAARWIALGLGGAALGAATIPALDARSIRAERAALRGRDGSFPIAAQERQRVLLERYERRRRTTGVLLGAGATLVLAAGAIHWLGGADTDSPGDLALGARAHGLELFGRF